MLGKTVRDVVELDNGQTPGPDVPAPIRFRGADPVKPG